MTTVEAHFTADAIRLYVAGHRLRLLWLASAAAWVCVTIDAVLCRRRDRQARG